MTTSLLTDYKEFVSSTSIYRQKIDQITSDEDVRKLLYILYVSNALGESGEVQNKVKKIFRDYTGELSPDIKGKILSELGDTLWYITAMCHELGFELADAMLINMGKLKERQLRGTIHGDNR